MENMDLLKALEDYGAELRRQAEEAKKARILKAREGLVELMLKCEHAHLPNPEGYEEDVKTFIYGLDDSVIEGGVNIFVSVPSGGEVLKVFQGVGYDLILEKSLNSTKNIVRVQFKDLEWILKNYFRKVIRMEDDLTAEAAKKILENLTKEGEIECALLEYEVFKEMVSQGDGELIALDANEQNKEHLALAYVRPGKCSMFVSTLKPRTDPITFTCKKVR